MEKNILLGEAIQNIRNDRQATEDLLTELKKELGNADTTHARSGIVAAKYVETLQRSNEQLVKIINILQKQAENEVDLSLDEEEKDNLFELIKGADA
tara:strand:- start:563 stop:853 length:291 start_codon:yes stop_codon:yes gene_type:complete